MEEILTERKFPFRTSGDLLRWCFAFGLDHLMKVDPPESGMMMYVTSQVRKLKDEMYQFEQLTEIDLLEQVVKHHLKIGTDANKIHALGLVVSAITDASRIKDKVWRKNMVHELQTKFEGVLKMKDELARMIKVVSIHPSDMLDEEGEDGDAGEVDTDE